MKTGILKAKILDLLIKGELTEKWRKDHKDIESAEILLEKIRSEKEKLHNDELIAKGKKPTAKVELRPVTDNDKAFEIPSKWKWCRLGDLVITMNDGPFGSDLKKEHYTENPEARIIQLSNIGEDGWREENKKYTTFEHAQEISRSIVEPGNIVIAKMMPAGRAIICPDHEKMFVLSSDSIKVIQSQQIYTKYLLYLFNSSFVRSSIAKTTKGTTRARTNIGSLKNTLLPLPPLDEQKELARIAEKLLAMVDDVDGSYSNLEELSKKAKAKVLDLLIKGELTSKWRDEHKDIEAADVLLEKIRSEKEKKLNDELIAKGKKTNAKVELKEVSKNDEPFEIPNSWKWCRLVDVATKLVDGDHNPPTGTSEKTEYLMISSRNINKNKIVDLNAVRYLTKEVFDEENKRTDLRTGDILITKVANLGRSCIYDGNLNLTFQRSVSIIQTLVNNSYIKVFFDAPYFQILIDKEATGTAQRGFYLNQLAKTLVPIPPLEEQAEIVQIAETLLNQIDSLTNIDSVQNGDEEDE